MPAASSHRVEAEPLEFDAGILFADESNYLCIPFDRLGLTDSTQVASIATSCECVRGSVVSFLTPDEMVARAVRLDFAPEAQSLNSPFIPVALSVEVMIKIAGIEKQRVFWIDLVHTTLHSSTRTSSADTFGLTANFTFLVRISTVGGDRELVCGTICKCRERGRPVCVNAWYLDGVSYLSVCLIATGFTASKWIFRRTKP